MIPQETIEELRQRASIVDVISERVPLKPRGANFIGLCPFHSEKTPSFTVSEEKKIYYCFGCQAKGNVVTFLMEYEQLSFPEAVKSIAARVGMELPRESRQEAQKRDKDEGLFGVNRIAADYYRKQLLGRGGAKAREYLKGRGVDGKWAETFALGYASESWDGLARHLSNRKVALNDAERVGLIVKKERGYYDRFRERLIIPIRDTSGRVVGFGGRSMSGREPKYLNSPESPLFKKSEVLYGLCEARKAIVRKGYALIVEGYFDLIALHIKGFTHTVATMGTALTGGHLRRLRGSAREIYTLFDGDDAGRKAAVRGLDLFLDEGVPSRAVFLPTGLDPDDFIRHKGVEALDAAVADAAPLMEFFLRELTGRYDCTTATGKVAFMDEALPRLRRIGNVTERGHYAEMVATLLAVGVDVVYTALKSAGKGSGGAPSVQGRERELIGIREGTKAEEQIVKVILFHPELLDDTVKEAVERFKSTVLRECARFVIGAIEGGGGAVDEAALFDTPLGEDEKSWLTRALIEGDRDIREAPRKIVEDCCKKIKGSGALAEGTQKLLKSLEDAGRQQEADLLRRGAKSYHDKR